MATRRSGPVCVFGFLLLLSIGMPVTSAHAQQAGAISEIENAELLFEEGVAAFERGEYATAHERFRLVSEYALNRKTTAALLMDGKALVQLGRYRDAIGRLEALLNQYAETTYRGEAERLLERARRRLQEETQAQDTLRVGVTLPMGAAEVSLSQALFNGIRLAVDEHNGLRRRYIRPPGLRTEADTFEVYDTARLAGDSLAAADGETTVAAPADTVRVDSLRVVAEQVERPDWVAKMYFRRTGPRPKAARAAVDSLVRLDDVDVILGPIRSRVARPAGERAEAARVPLVAPMATDESVSEGKNYVFQANPTIPDRGRIMARTAKNGLLIDRVGIVYEAGNGLSARMAEGFREEARRQDLTVPLSIPLQGARDWSRLPTLIEDSTLIETNARRARRDSVTIDSLLAETEALYLPVSGRGTAGKIQGALTGLRQILPGKRVLGNAEWHDLPFKEAASAAIATYTNGFYVQTDRPAVQRFVRRYRLLTGSPPDELATSGRRLAYVGYDVARFLLTTLSPSGTGPTPRALRTAPTYEGIGMRIGFQGDNANQALFIHRYRDQRTELLR
ncbi:ABC transporter substrate-binding protein [Salinibacter ruber]|uniref:ABC transporter substrate-binding protein n=1 Tax=Salinibacter ruber TaxID=146919 RepID=UPI002167AC0E|nr:ABC transporter substrate-binding protein [Salinibacter ruber]MCS3684330.1 ABC-type branched-subunit amino acid transport system substrate-binding protein [Salinibacter ruber]